MIIHSYIFKSILYRTVYLTSITCIVLLMLNSITLLEFVVNRTLSGKEFLTMMGYLVPQYMVKVLPLTTFIATLITYNTLLQTRELTILHSIGRSAMQILRPAIYAGGVCTCISIILYGYLMPEGLYRFATQKQIVAEKTLLAKQIISGNFQSIGNNSTMFVENVKGNRLENIFIYNAQDNVILTASSGEIVESPNMTTIILKNGTQQSNLEGDTSPPIISFSEYNMHFKAPRSAKWEKKYMYQFTNTEILSLYTHTQDIKYIAEFLRRLLDSVLPLILCVMGAITILIKPIHRITKHRYIVLGFLTMITTLSINMTLSSWVEKSILYLAYNAIFIGILLMGMGLGLIYNQGWYTKRTKACKHPK